MVGVIYIAGGGLGYLVVFGWVGGDLVCCFRFGGVLWIFLGLIRFLGFWVLGYLVQGWVLVLGVFLVCV